MGSLPRPPRLTEAEIVARYEAGEGRGMIGLRAGIPDHRVKAILEAAGVELRAPVEAQKLGLAAARTRRSNSRRKPRPAYRAAEPSPW